MSKISIVTKYIQYEINFKLAIVSMFDEKTSNIYLSDMLSLFWYQPKRTKGKSRKMKIENINHYLTVEIAEKGYDLIELNEHLVEHYCMVVDSRYIYNLYMCFVQWINRPNQIKSPYCDGRFVKKLLQEHGCCRHENPQPCSW